jgi:predicted nucleotidyltransferase
MTEVVHIPDGDRDFVIANVRSIFPLARILAFGSRVRGDHRLNSDLDLCLDNKESLDLTQLSELREKLSESHLLYKIDIVDWNRITPEFRSIIAAQNVELDGGAN